MALIGSHPRGIQPSHFSIPLSHFCSRQGSPSPWGPNGMTARFHLERHARVRILSRAAHRRSSFLFIAVSATGLAFGLDPAQTAAQAPAWLMPADSSAETSACIDDSWHPVHSLAIDSAAAAPAEGAPQPAEPFPTNTYQAPWSRIGVGADVSPLGVGMKATTVLNTFMDLRVDGNFFRYDIGRFEIDGINVDGQLHLASAAAKLDVYPWLSVWRVSAGLTFFNGNHLYAATRIAPATPFSVDGKTYYSANANPATGAIPVSGSGTLALHSRQPAFVLSGGFGRFIPRSQRHWSFPSEFGVIFMGAPTIQVNLGGWVCTDKAQTQCASLANSASPITASFNSSLQSSLTKWRHDVSGFTMYPVFSYSVVYSFNTPRFSH